MSKGHCVRGPKGGNLNSHMDLKSGGITSVPEKLKVILSPCSFFSPAFGLKCLSSSPC